jgi:hypothetical protein
MKLKVLGIEQSLISHSEHSFTELRLRLEGETTEFKSIDYSKLFRCKSIESLNKEIQEINGENDIYYQLVDRIIRKIKTDKYNEYQKDLLRFIIEELKLLKNEK